MLRILAWIPVVMLCGCATGVPPAIRQPVAGPDVATARKDIAAVEGQRVRWGGEIAKVDNRPDHTLVEVVSRPLEKGGRPRSSDATGGRFLARIPGFIDPAVYKADRLFTVTGTVTGSVVRKVGEYPYRYPVVDVESYHLWEPLTPAYGYPYPGPYRPWYPYGWYDPLWYDPAYGPWL